MASEVNRFPRKIAIRKHLTVEIRPLETTQIEKLMELYSVLDEKALARLPHDVNAPNHPKYLKRRMEDGYMKFLAAWHNKRIIGALTLFLNDSLWTRHIAEVVFVSHPDYRRYGTASVLFEECLLLAESLGIEKIYAHLSPDHTEAAKMLKIFGFSREATLKDHIKDRYGRYRDMRIYSLDLEGAHKAMEELIAGFSDYAG